MTIGYAAELRVIKAGDEYWAIWGATARARVAEEPQKIRRAYA